MSRGLSERDAKKLIVEASFRPIIDSIPSDELREEINLEVERRFANV
jgi:Fe-S cluster assembly scaffold protein SufB